MTRKRSYQKGSVAEKPRNSGQWTLRFREFDHTTRRWVMKREVLGQFKSKKAALKASEPIMARINERNNCPSPRALYSDLTFKEFIEKRWNAYTVSAEHQVSTINSNNSLIKIHLMPFFGNKRMAEITPSDISDFFGSRARERERALSGYTLQGLYRLLHLMFEIARQYDLIEQSPVRPLVHKPQIEKVEKPTLRPEQIRALLLRLPAQERLYLLLLAVTGLRMGEALAMRWLNFDEASREIAVTHTLYRSRLKAPKTKGSKAKLRLHPLIAELLAGHRRQSGFQADEDFIFCRPDGKPLGFETVRAHLHKAMDAIGIVRVKGQFSFHIFRHTAGTLLYDKVRDVKQVQTMLRHADISTTADVYVHPSESTAAEGTEIRTEAILGDLPANCDLFVTQTSEMVS